MTAQQLVLMPFRPPGDAGHSLIDTVGSVSDVSRWLSSNLGARQLRLPAQAQRDIHLEKDLDNNKNKSPDTLVIPNGYDMSQVCVA